MKFAPSIAFHYLPKISLSVCLSHQLRQSGPEKQRASTGFAFGVQPGIIFKPIDNLSLGLTYTSAQKINYDNVTDFNQDGTYDRLDWNPPSNLVLVLLMVFLTPDWCWKQTLNG